MERGFSVEKVSVITQMKHAACSSPMSLVCVPFPLSPVGVPLCPPTLRLSQSYYTHMGCASLRGMPARRYRDTLPYQYALSGAYTHFPAPTPTSIWRP